MTAPGHRGHSTELLDLPGGELEVLDLPGERDGHPLVLLHGGLGSAELWDQFPHTLNNATGCRTVAFSRHGHGRSARPPRPRTPAFMYEEAREVLPELLTRLRLERPVLVGHSDGASIALIYAADHEVPGLVAIAPHVVVEQVCIDEITRARDRYEHGDLRRTMTAHHRDVDAAFFGWCGVWLDPAFRAWDIRELVKRVNSPLLLIQGLGDQYGTLAQLDEIERLAPGRVQRLHLDCRHSPFVQCPEETVEAIARFAGELTAGDPAAHAAR
jgi:pimeloyl-ACP methyl ester carboxylesterase